MGSGSSPSYSTTNPATCDVPGKAEKDGLSAWDPVPMQATQKQLLAPSLDAWSIPPLATLSAK